MARQSLIPVALVLGLVSSCTASTGSPSGRQSSGVDEGPDVGHLPTNGEGDRVSSSDAPEHLDGFVARSRTGVWCTSATDLHADLPGTTFALDINERGMVLGHHENPYRGAPNMTSRVFVWDGGRRTDVGTL